MNDVAFSSETAGVVNRFKSPLTDKEVSEKMKKGYVYIRMIVMHIYFSEINKS